MKFSVITPSYNQPEWLALCCASVADQHSIEFEHIIQDNLSDYEMNALVSRFVSSVLFSEKDQGLYEAVNRGWHKATGDIICHLNCDEQLLPGALARVAKIFANDPSVDVVVGSVIVVDANCDYICSRLAVRPRSLHMLLCSTPIFTCATFIRRSAYERGNLSYREEFKVISDVLWFKDMLDQKMNIKILKEYTSVFVDSGENLNLGSEGKEERASLKTGVPASLRWLAPIFRVEHWIRKFLAGNYRLNPFNYEVFTPKNPTSRIRIEVEKPGFFWKTYW